MGELLGLGILLGVALVVVVLVLSAIIARGAVRPPRHTAGYAVARGLPVDPGDVGLRYESWDLDLPDGVCLPVWEVTGNGAGPTVVIVHDWGQSRIDELRRLDPWRELGGRVVLYDLRGHGDASGAGSRLGDGEEKDLLALLERLGDGPFVLVGRCMGAAIAIRAAVACANGEESIAGVVAYAPYRRFHDSLCLRLGASGFPTRPLTDVAMAWLALGGVRDRDLDRDRDRLSRPLLVLDEEGESHDSAIRSFFEAAPNASSSGPR